MRVYEIIKGMSDNRKEQPKSELEPLVILKFRSQRTKEEPAKKCQNQPGQQGKLTANEESISRN